VSGGTVRSIDRWQEREGTHIGIMSANIEVRINAA
jgi:hypothetical protein